MSKRKFSVEIQKAALHHTSAPSVISQSEMPPPPQAGAALNIEDRLVGNLMGGHMGDSPGRGNVA